MVADPLGSGAASAPARPFGGFFRRSGAQLEHYQRLIIAAGLFFGFAAYYGICLYPGVGGEINGGDSAKFQVLAHAQIMVHGPGYPLYLMLSAALRALDLPVPGWWQIAFAFSAVPGALATSFAFLIANRATGSVRFGLAAALLLGGAHLMAIQATEAEVYALNIAFVLAVVYFLLLFVETERLFFFLTASAIYAISFGNHLMMVMLLPLFVALSVRHYRMLLRPKPIAIVAAFILLGASQYLYLAYVAYDPATGYSEYMPLPPTPEALLNYIIGTYFSDLYGSGLNSSRTLAALGDTFQNAHPWLSIPLVVAGLAVFLFRGRGLRDPAWRKIALVFAAALCFLPFVLWYGAWDIEAFHLPLLALALLAATASIGWATRTRPLIFRSLGLLLILIGAARIAQTGVNLTDRESPFEGIVPQIKAVVAQLPPGDEKPILALGYGVRMAAMYHYFAGHLPRGPEYRLAWRMPGDIARRSMIIGAMMPESALEFVRRVQQVRPDLTCQTRPLTIPGHNKHQAYSFCCTAAGGRRGVGKDRPAAPLADRLETERDGRMCAIRQAGTRHLTPPWSELVKAGARVTLPSGTGVPFRWRQIPKPWGPASD